MRQKIHSEDGANAVEFALVLPLLVMLIFGAITAGLALNTRQQLDHAAREGVRYAATLPTGTQPCDAVAPFRSWQECVRDRVVVTSVGSVRLPDSGICVAKIEEDGSAARWLYGAAAADPGAAANHCIAESPSLSGSRVQVKVTTPSVVNAVFVRTGAFDLTARSVAKYEVAP